MPDGPPRKTRGRLVALLGVIAVLSLPDRPAEGQYTLRAPSGDSLVVDSAAVQEMLRESRRLRSILEEDPDVLYYIGSGPTVTAESPEPAYPWQAVLVRNDSVARVAFPANYREADRAYYNYAVRKMEMIRSRGPAVRCSVTVEREVELASAFTDGWIVARALFGGPAFAPLDAFAFAREAGHLPAMIVALDNDALGGCRDRWRGEHPDEMEAYRAWRGESFGHAAADTASDTRERSVQAEG